MNGPTPHEVYPPIASEGFPHCQHNPDLVVCQARLRTTTSSLFTFPELRSYETLQTPPVPSGDTDVVSDILSTDPCDYESSTDPYLLG